MGSKLRRLTQAECGSVAFELMRDVFEIHQEFGRFFDEKIYKRELARRRADVGMEPRSVWRIKVTAFSEHLDAFEAHARRFLQHTALNGILWINIARNRVTLTSVR
jgi:hypothetical protein